jgi:hypothetical protein
MKPSFEYSGTLEQAWQRRVRFVVEVSDAVTGELIGDGISVRVKGFKSAPIVNATNRFVWLAESGAVPTEVEVTSGRLPFLPQTVPAPPPPGPPPAPQYNVVRVTLAPTGAYPFDTGASGIRGTLVRLANEWPPVALPGKDVWLQWMDDNVPAPGWTDSTIVSKTDTNGDFAVIVRLAINQIARVDTQQRMRVRVAATHAGSTKFSPEQQIQPGYVADVPQSFAWDQFAV